MVARCINHAGLQYLSLDFKATWKERIGRKAESQLSVKESASLATACLERFWLQSFRAYDHVPLIASVAL